jgi:gas vesicle protein
MNFDSKTLLISSIVLIIGAVIGASAASVFADDPFKGKSSLNRKKITRMIVMTVEPQARTAHVQLRHHMMSIKLKSIAKIQLPNRHKIIN